MTRAAAFEQLGLMADGMVPDPLDYMLVFLILAAVAFTLVGAQ